MEPLVRFYRGEAPDDLGRYLDEVWGWDFDRLERTHNYIQWLFPLPEPSGVHPAAPLLDRRTFAAFAGDEHLRAKLGRSLSLMLRFYGYRLVEADGGPDLEATADQAARQEVWLTPLNHNFLRITRILRSTTLLGLPVEAHAFYAALSRLYRATAPGVIGEVTFDFWTRAVIADGCNEP